MSRKLSLYSPVSKSYLSVPTDYDVMSNFQISSNRARLKAQTTQIDQSKARPMPEYKINGEDYFQDHISLNRIVEALEDSFSVKGAYLYINKGKRVYLTSVIGEYSQIFHNGKIAYFPSKQFKYI